MYRRLAYALLSQAKLDSNNPLEILSTNTIQKDLTGVDPLLRSLAVRSAVQMSNVSGINQLGIIRTALADSSVYVRKTACAALRSLLSTTNTTPDIIDMVHRSLYDSEPSVLSTAVQAAWVIRNDLSVFPRAIFSRLITHLPQMDHYGQFFAIDLLYRYCVFNFSPDSTQPDLIAFINLVDNDILPYTSSPAIVEISLIVLADLTIQRNHCQIWSHIIHHLSRLPYEYSERILKLALSLMKSDDFIKSCPFDHLFVRSDDTVSIATLKIKILSRFTPTAPLSHAKVILREFLDYIDRIENVGAICVSGIAKIGHHFSELSETVLRILLTLISDESVSDEVTSESISRIRHVVGSLSVSSQSILDTIRLVCDKAHTLKNDSTTISALWLMTVYHDSIALVVPNVLRAFGARIHEQSPLVKLQLCILAHESMRYYSSEERRSEKVSKMIFGPLNELVEYIFGICGGDQMIGDAVTAMRKGGITVSKFTRNDGNEVESGSDGRTELDVFMNEKRMRERPKTDRIGVEEEADETKTEGKSTLRNMSSEQSSMNRTSAKVLVPSSVKPITKLEDLDLFFSVQETVAEDDAENIKSGNSKGSETSVQATIDLTGFS